jgi:hypothetical protein
MVVAVVPVLLEKVDNIFGCFGMLSEHRRQFRFSNETCHTLSRHATFTHVCAPQSYQSTRPSNRPSRKGDVRSRHANAARDAFLHAYKSYLAHAAPHDELHPQQGLLHPHVT